MYIVRPKFDVPPELLTSDLPLFYFIGPVRGGGDHQWDLALRFDEAFDGEVIIMVPCRWDMSHPASRHFVGVMGNYRRQRFWEQPSIRTAHTRPRSALVAWLPAQREPRTDGGPYGRDTMGEVGYFRGLIESMRKEDRHKFLLALGGEEGFPGIDVIRDNYDYSYGSPFPFQSTVEGLLRRSIELVQ